MLFWALTHSSGNLLRQPKTKISSSLTQKKRKRNECSCESHILRIQPFRSSSLFFLSREYFVGRWHKRCLGSLPQFEIETFQIYVKLSNYLEKKKCNLNSTIFDIRRKMVMLWFGCCYDFVQMVMKSPYLVSFFKDIKYLLLFF